MNNKLTRINEGGLHSQNPNGGVPIGNNNTVEEGETINNNGKNKYVYSNRLFLNGDLIKNMNLPKYITGQSFSKASENIDNKFKDRNDKPSLETKNTLLDRLAQAQESVKQHIQKVNEAMSVNSQEVPDQMNGDIPQGMEEYSDQNRMSLGGFEDDIPGLGVRGVVPGVSVPSAKVPGAEIGAKVGNSTTGAKPTGPGADAYLGAATGAYSLANLSQGVGASPIGNSTAISGALTGAGAGSAFGPIGAGIGAVVGLGAGILGAGKASDASRNLTTNNAINYNRNVSEQFKYGGNINKMAPGGFVPFEDSLDGYLGQNKIQPNSINFNSVMRDSTNTIPEVGATRLNRPQATGIDTTGLADGNISASLPRSTTGTTEKPKKGNYSGIANQAMRATPILSNFMQLNSMTKPTGVSYVPLRNTYKYDPIDEARQERIISQEGNKQLSAIEQSGGSEGAIRNAIVSSGLNTTNARSMAATNTEQQNREQRIQGRQAQLGVDQYNNQNANKAIDEMRMDQGNYDTQRSKFIGAIGTEIGQVGKERTYADKAGQIFGYDENGKYLVGADGNKIRVPDSKQTALTAQQQAYLDTMPKAFGGYVRTNKKGY